MARTRISFGEFVFVSSIICQVLSSDTIRFFTAYSNSCRFTLVESTPVDLTYPKGSPLHLSTYDAHKRLIGLAKKSIHISSFYWTLRGNDTTYHDESSYQGEDIFNRLRDVAKSKSIELKIAQNVTNAVTDVLAQDGALVRTVDFQRLMKAGVLHTKMWIVDDTHMYVGSANFDWRSYTQVKEIGILIENCKCLVSDAAKIFESMARGVGYSVCGKTVYWFLGDPRAQIPNLWPSSYSTSINARTPAVVHYNDTKGKVYFSSSPPPFCPTGRANDIDAILDVINSAKEFVYISVMDYMPSFIYTDVKRFWPIIDDALRKVAYDKKIKVFFMAGTWKHTFPDMYRFLHSLKSLNGLRYGKVDFQVKQFRVPAFTPSQRKIPFARVCHDKYMVTDQHAYIGTSNWSADYFVSTGGVGFVLNQPKNHTSTDISNDLRQQLEDAFLRDWHSGYSEPLY